MAHKNNKTANGETFTGRLLQCVEKAGGKRRLAERTLISEAQLFRYLNGLADVPAERVVGIAKAAGVDAGWLLTGHGSAEAAPAADRRPTFRPALMQYTARLLDEFLLEYQRSFSPRMKSQLLTLIYEALRHEEVLHGQEGLPNKYKILSILGFMDALKTEELVEVYHRVMTLLEYEGPLTAEHQQLLNTFCGLVSAGARNLYESYPGEAYYERMGMELSEEAQTQFKAWLAQAFEIHHQPNLKVLDLGCGNGRHLAWLHQHYPALSLSGVDIADQAVKLCEKLVTRGKLPMSCVQQAGCQDLPQASDSQHLVHARHVLHAFPWLPGTGLGLEAAFGEINRVLVKGGLLCLTHFHGNGREYSAFEQLLSFEMLETLAATCGFRIVQSTLDGRISENPGTPVVAFTPRHKQVLRATLQKI